MVLHRRAGEGGLASQQDETGVLQAADPVLPERGEDSRLVAHLGLLEEAELPVQPQEDVPGPEDPVGILGLVGLAGVDPVADGPAAEEIPLLRPHDARVAGCVRRLERGDDAGIRGALQRPRVEDGVLSGEPRVALRRSRPQGQPLVRVETFVPVRRIERGDRDLRDERPAVSAGLDEERPVGRHRDPEAAPGEPPGRTVPAPVPQEADDEQERLGPGRVEAQRRVKGADRLGRLPRVREDLARRVVGVPDFLEPASRRDPPPVPEEGLRALSHAPEGLGQVEHRAGAPRLAGELFLEEAPVPLVLVPSRPPVVAVVDRETREQPRGRAFRRLEVLVRRSDETGRQTRADEPYVRVGEVAVPLDHREDVRLELVGTEAVPDPEDHVGVEKEKVATREVPAQLP